MIARLSALSLLLTLAACGRDHESAAAPADPDPARAQDPPTTAADPTAPDPERGARLDDLNTLCAALNHDYVDGTLSDYFAGVTTKTQWGAGVLAGGNDADRPGRYLESQIETLSPKAADPALPACRELLDYLDEVE